MGLALYRKYRPTVFEDVIGQEQVTSVLKNEVKENHPAQAYLFTGSRGTGKTTCAKILSKAFNCTNPHDGDPCCQCEICTGIQNGSILDVVEIDAASNSGVDDIRQMREEATYTPAMCKYRVYIIDEVHMLSTNAFNALLKIMEEPPPHVIFILATTEVHKIPATVLSRCQSFEFKKFSKDDIYSRLLTVCEKEGFTLSQDGGMLIAELAHGGMRDALSILDVCCSQSSIIDETLVVKLTGLAQNEHIFNIANMIIDCDCSGILNAFDVSYENSVEPQRLCQQLVEHFRDLMLCISVKNPDKYVQSGKNPDIMVKQAQKAGIEKILYTLNVLQTALDAMQSTTMRELQLEMSVIKLCMTENSNNTTKIDNNIANRLDLFEKRLDELIRNRIKYTQDFDDDKNSSITPKKSSLYNPIIEVKDAMRKKAVPLKKWIEVMALLEKTNGALYGTLTDSKAYTCDDILLIECQNELFLNLIRENEYAKNSLRKCAFDVLGQRYKLGPFRKDVYEILEKEDPLVEFINKLDTSYEEIELK